MLRALLRSLSTPIDLGPGPAELHESLGRLAAELLLGFGLQVYALVVAAVALASSIYVRGVREGWLRDLAGLLPSLGGND